MEKRRASLTPKQALLKAANYCAYQERCHQEVIEKLCEWGIYDTDAGEIILSLIEQNYLNEERFAKTFAGGKFRVKGWGKVKIILELKAKKVSEYCIRQALLEIDDDQYEQKLTTLLQQKMESVKDRNILVKRNKAAQFAIGKGYEAGLVWNVLKTINL